MSAFWTKTGRPSDRLKACGLAFKTRSVNSLVVGQGNDRNNVALVLTAKQHDTMTW